MFQRLQFVPQRELKNVISERRIPGQDRTVGIGTDHGAGNCALGTVVAVTDPDFHRRKRLDASTQPGVAAVVLKSGQPLIITVSPVPAANDLADGTRRPT